MHASLQNSAQLTHHMSADARAMLSLRKEMEVRYMAQRMQGCTKLNCAYPTKCYHLGEHLKHLGGDWVHYQFLYLTAAPRLVDNEIIVPRVVF